MILQRKLKQTRRLMQFLFFSGGLNIILATLLGYIYVTEKSIAPVIEQKPAAKQALETPLAIDRSGSEVIRYFKSLSFEQLVAKLQDSRLVENGYAQRDFALAILAAFQHFDLTRALKGTPQPIQKRLITFGMQQNGKPSRILVYPGLTDRHFQAIIDFAKTERWPQTGRGLFAMLRTQEPPNPSLVDAFFLTPEFTSVEMLFKRSGVVVDKSELIAVIREGSWPLLYGFTEQQRLSQDLSPAKRQRFLIDYIKMNSRAAASLMLKTDGSFAAKKLDDETVASILNLSDENTPEAEKFALELLTSPRSDAIWKLAAGRLYEFAGEKKPDKSLHHAALNRFLPQATYMQPKKIEELLTLKEESIPAPLIPKRQQYPIEKTYIVQDGDNLWKIARRFQVDIDTIRSHNHLEGDFLHPGNVLRIP